MERAVRSAGRVKKNGAPLDLDSHGPPLVSVVTPCLDPGSRIERCLRSVREQSYPRVEHVVIDGGSKDGTRELLELTPGVVWLSEEDSGQAEAINKGFRLAEGSILGWLNSDDQLVPDAIERVVAAFLADPMLGWVFGDVQIIDGEQVELAKPVPPEKPLQWAARNIAAQPGSFHSRRALELVDYLDEDFHYMMDLDLWLRMIDAGVRFRYIGEILAVFEVHPGSKTGSVPHQVFVKEEGLARLKSGRTRSAAIAFGRAAAWVAREAGNDDDAALEDAVGSILAHLGPKGRQVPQDLLIAGARTERAILHAKSDGWRAARLLLSSHIWRHPETRSRLRDAASRELGRRMRRTRRAL